MPSVKVAQPRVSFTDLQRMPEDGRRIELYDGEVFELPSPIPRHQVVADNIKQLLGAYSRTRGALSFISPIDIVFSEYDVVQPDVVFFTQTRRRLVDFDQAIRHAPDLVVEVLSPGTRANDHGRKMAMFEQGAYRLLQTACGDDGVRSARLADLRFSAGAVFRMP